MPMFIRNNINLIQSGDFSIMMYADIGHVHQIMTNFILNSIDAIEGGGDITIHVEQKANMAVFTVSDTGKGIKPEHMNSITTPFFTTKTTGVGLGLPIAFQLADLNAGHIKYESKEGEGTFASLYLPAEKY